MNKKNVDDSTRAEEAISEVSDQELENATGGLTLAPRTLIDLSRFRSVALPSSALDITRIFTVADAHRS